MHKVEMVEFKSALSERYLAYAMSTIVSRSLPDVRDGLKPVHRRILYAMYQLKLDPKSGLKKCARIVGDVIGRFHPHGDASVYDALVRMAQLFAARYPIVFGQGNFGSIDGDAQAAMRYTEAKLTDYAMLLLRDIENNTVDFQPNYDGNDDEPKVLPALIPNILANGTEGIAVGMATSIPPHNITELLDALVHLVKSPASDTKELLRIISGPDFPTGGILVDPPEEILKTYSTGRGSFRLRCRWMKEMLPGGKYQIVITEIPYQVQKKNLIEQLANLFNNKKTPYLDDIQDMSAEDVRIVLTPKSRTINAEAIMQQLYKISDLEVRISLNMNVLNAYAQPMVMNLAEVLNEFLAHRTSVAKRKLQYREQQIIDRLEVLAALLIAYLNLDEVIRIIRNEDEPKTIMIERWSLTDRQAEAILNTRLRALRKLEEQTIHHEHALLTQEKAEINELLTNHDAFNRMLIADFKAIKKQILSKRRTSLEAMKEEEPIEITKLLEREPVSIYLLENDHIKIIKGHKPQDKEAINAYSTDKILLFSSSGKCYTLAIDKLARGKKDGEPLRLLLDVAAEEKFLWHQLYQPAQMVLLVSTSGHGFITKSCDMLAHTKTGKQILQPAEGHTALTACSVNQNNYVALFSEGRRLLVFNIKDIPYMQRGKGVALQKIKVGKLVAVLALPNLEAAKEYAPFSHTDIKLWVGNRGALGRLTLSKTWIDN